MLARMLDELGYHRVDVLGFSWGARRAGATIRGPTPRPLPPAGADHCAFWDKLFSTPPGPTVAGDAATLAPTTATIPVTPPMRKLLAFR